MPSRPWIFAITIGLIAAISGAQSQDAPQPQKPAIKSSPISPFKQNKGDNNHNYSARGDQNYSFDYTPIFERIERAIRDAIPKKDKAENEWEKKQKIRDLEAQEGMALWAQLMFWAAAITAGITFAGLVLLNRTLKATKIGAEAAKGMLVQAELTTRASLSAVEQARRTNTIAIENARAEQRPWVRFNIKFESPFSKGINAYSNSVHTMLFNDGRSPALDVYMTWETHIRVIDDIEMTNMFRRLSERTNTPGGEPGEIIYPDQSSQANLMITFDKLELEAAMNAGGGGPRLWFSIGAIYRDRYRDRWYRTGAIYELFHLRKTTHYIAAPTLENMTSFENGIIVLRPHKIVVIE